MVMLKHFKLYLDKENLEKTFKNHPENAAGTHDDIRRYFRDFLRKLYGHIEQMVTDKFDLSDWSETAVHFVFSVPTLWDNRPVAEDFKKIAEEAGFGKEGERHEVELSLNEAEAAAIYTALSSQRQQIQYMNDDDDWSDDDVNPAVLNLSERPRLQQNDVVLVVDSGGGTTDIATLQVGSVKVFDDTQEEEISQLKLLPGVSGSVAQTAAVGSVQIDEAFQELVRRRLEPIPDHFLSGSPNLKASLAKNMANSNFQHFKHVFGSRICQSLKRYYFRVPGLRRDYNDEEAGVENDRLVFTRDEIAALFDEQVEKIFQLMDAELDRPENVSHIILSGGLGSSHYVQRRIVERYCSCGVHKQLAVSRGLAIDKLHRLKYNHAILNLVCKASYGILYDEPIDRPQRSTSPGPPVYRNPLDGQWFATDHICWMVTKGEPVLRGEPVCQPFFRMVSCASVDTSLDCIRWVDTIAMSKAEPDNLPVFLDKCEARRVDKIVSELPLNHFLTAASDAATTTKPQKRQHWPFHRVKYWQVDLELRMYPSPAGIQFQIWCDNRCIGDTAEIPVNWEYLSSHRGQDLLMVGDAGDADDSEPDAPKEEPVDSQRTIGLVPSVRRDEKSSGMRGARFLMARLKRRLVPSSAS